MSAVAIACVAAMLAATPSRAAGDTFTQAQTRVAEVTVYSDRARVVRRASVELEGGMSTVDLGELPTTALAQTVRVSAGAGAAVRRVDVEVVPSLATHVGRPEVDELIAKLEELRDQATLLARDAQVLDHELGLLTSAHPQPLPPEAARLEAKSAMAAAPDQWGKVLDFVDARMATARKARAELATKQRTVGEALAKLAAEAQRRGLDTSVRVAPRVHAVLETSHAGRVALELEYFVNEASWRPRYDLQFDSKSGVVKLLTGASVSQRSGEDWDEAKLHFSTAMPGQGIELPELLTWTIGEQRDFVPTARRAPGQPQPSRLPPPPAVAVTALDPSQLALQQRVQRLATLAAQSVDSAQNTAGLAEEMSGLGRIASATHSGGSSAGSAAPALRAAPPAAPPAMKRQASAAPSNGPAAAPVMDDMPAMPMSAREPSAAEPQRPGSMAKPAPSGLALGLDDAPPRPSLTDPSLPAVAAGGLDYVWSASTASTVASTGEAVNVPLDAQRYPVKPTYEATPALENVAFLHAAVVNGGGRPLLTGPLSVFAGGVFIADSVLATTGPGASIELPLGADQDVRLTRRLQPRTTTKGIIAKDEITRYEVEIDVANYKRQAVRVHVVDQIPTTDNHDVHIELVGMSPTASDGPDPRGIIGWQIEIAAGKTRTIKLAYEIKRPANWRLWQM